MFNSPGVHGPSRWVGGKQITSNFRALLLGPGSYSFQTSSLRYCICIQQAMHYTQRWSGHTQWKGPCWHTAHTPQLPSVLVHSHLHSSPKPHTEKAMEMPHRMAICCFSICASLLRSLTRIIILRNFVGFPPLSVQNAPQISSW